MHKETFFQGTVDATEWDDSAALRASWNILDLIAFTKWLLLAYFDDPSDVIGEETDDLFMEYASERCDKCFKDYDNKFIVIKVGIQEYKTEVPLWLRWFGNLYKIDDFSDILWLLDQMQERKHESI